MDDKGQRDDEERMEADFHYNDLTGQALRVMVITKCGFDKILYPVFWCAECE